MNAPRTIAWLAATTLVLGTAGIAITEAVAEKEAASRDHEAHDPADHEALEHRFVRITSASLAPKTLTLTEGQAFGWVNYSSKQARVSFDRQVAKKMVCTTLTSFRMSGERLESQPIQARGFASLCKLKPGRYPYQVELFSGAGSGSGRYGRVLEGELLIE